MNIWAIGKDGKPLTVKQLSKLSDGIAGMLADDEIVCCSTRSGIQEWIRAVDLTDCEPVKIWSGK